ncbi:MAG: hypothetical protein MUE85_10075 [Microscillaceae bacterium]|jgi:hypothetical protein|nr:hypothetical protein [Microscillaceae bacterium]
MQIEPSKNLNQDNETLQVARPPRSFRWLRRLLYGVLLGFGLGLLGFVFFLLFYLNPVLQYELSRRVAESTDSLYTLEIKHLRVNALRGNVAINRFHLIKNIERWQALPSNEKAKYNLDLNLQVNQINAQGIHWVKYLLSGELAIDQLFLRNPTLQLKNQPTAQGSRNAKPFLSQTQNLLSRFAKQLIVKDLIIEDGELSLNLKQPQGDILHQGDSLFVRVWGGQISTTTLPQMQNFVLQAKNYKFNSADGVYEFSANEILLHSADSLLRMDNLKVKPRSILQLNSLANIRKYQATRLDWETKQIESKGIDYQRLIYKQELSVNSVKIANSRFLLSTNRALQTNFSATRAIVPALRRDFKYWDLKKYMRNIPFFIQIDTLQLANTDFYLETSQGKAQPISYHKGDSLQLNFYGLHLGKALDDTTARRALYSQAVDFQVFNYQHLTPDGIYHIAMKKARVSSRDSVIAIENAVLKSQVSRGQYAQLRPYQNILLEAKVNRLQANKLDIERLAYRQEFVMGGLHLYQPDFEAFVNRKLPRRSGQKYQNFEQLLQSIPLYIVMDTLALHRGKLKYIEQDSLLDTDREGFAEHQAENIELRAYKIQLGQALNGSVLAEIDTKSLLLDLQNYRYQTPNGLYELKLQHLEVSSAKSLIWLDSVQFRPRLPEIAFCEGQTYRRPFVEIGIKNVRGQKIDFKKLLLKQEIDWQFLAINQPKINIYTDRRKPKRPQDFFELDAIDLPIDSLAHYLNDSLSKPYNVSGQRQLRRLLAELPAYVKIDTLHINEATVKYRSQDWVETGSGVASHQAENISCKVFQIHLGKAQNFNADSTKRVFYSENVYFTLKNYQFKDKNDLYIFTLKNIAGYLADSILAVDNLHLRPLDKPQDFFKKQAFRRLYTDIELKSVQTNSIDLQRLLFEQELVVKTLRLNKPQVRFLNDKNLPIDKLQARFKIEDLLERMPFYLQIDTFALDDAVWEYTEWQQADNQQDTVRHRAERLDLQALDLRLGLDKRTSQTPDSAQTLAWLKSHNFSLQLENYQWLTPKRDYSLGFQKLAYLPQKSLIQIDNLHYLPQKDLTEWQKKPQEDPLWAKILIPRAEIKANDWEKLWDKSDWHLSTVKIHQPHLEFYQSLGKTKSINRKSLKLPYQIVVDSLQIADGKLSFSHEIAETWETRVQNHSLQSLDLQLFKFHLDSNTLQREDRFLGAENFVLQAQNYQTALKENLYHLKIKQIAANSQKGDLRLENLDIRPFAQTNWDTLTTRNVFFWQKGKQTEFFDSTTIVQTQIKGLNFLKLLNERELIAQKVELNGLNTAIFRDKRWEEDVARVPLMLNQKFQQIPFPVKIDTLQVKQARLHFLQRVPNAEEYGKIFFDAIDLEAFPISTEARADSITTFKVKSRLMGEGNLDFTLKISLKKPQLFCKYYGSLGAMNAQILNEIIEANRPIRVKSGLIQKIKFDVFLVDKTAKGTVEAGYKRLRIQFLKADDHEKKRGFITFWANVFLKNRNNLEKNRHKIGEVNYTRTNDDGFFAVLWRALATGLLDTLK